MMQDLSWKMKIQLRHLLWLGIQNTQSPFGIIRMYRKGDMYRAKMNSFTSIEKINFLY